MDIKDICKRPIEIVKSAKAETFFVASSLGAIALGVVGAAESSTPIAIEISCVVATLGGIALGGSSALLIDSVRHNADMR